MAESVAKSHEIVNTPRLDRMAAGNLLCTHGVFRVAGGLVFSVDLLMPEDLAIIHGCQRPICVYQPKDIAQNVTQHAPIFPDFGG
jgi:hypothetical protein